MSLTQKIRRKQSHNYYKVNGVIKFIQTTPIFRVLLGYIVGILLFQITHISLGILYIVLLITFLFSLYILFYRKQKYKNRWFWGVFITLFFISLGYYNCKWFEQRSEFSILNKKGLYLVEVLSAPSEISNSYKCEIKLIRQIEPHLDKKVFGKAILYLQKEKNHKPTFFIGDYLLVNTRFQTIEKPQNPNEFNYSKYLKRRGFLATAYVTSNRWEKTNLPVHQTIKRLSNISRNHLLNIYKKYGIEGEQFALLAAITLGYKEEIELETKNNFSRSGAAHILVISGLHIGIIYGILMFVFGFWRTNKQNKIIKAILVTILIWIFAFITGLSPAVQRATIMMTFVTGATCFERKPQIFNTIFSSAFIMLLFNPNLFFNIGFQLSYSAVLSIIYFQPKFAKLIVVENKFVRWAWVLLTVTISAQIGIFPLAIYYFQQFSNYFIITNFITIPLTTFILYLSIILISISYILPFVAVFVAFLLKIALEIMLKFVGYIASLPFSITEIGVTNSQLILIYTFIFSITIFFNKKRANYLIYSLISLLLIVSISAKRTYNSFIKKQLTVFSNSKAIVINVLENGNNYVLTTDNLMAVRNGQRYWLINHYPQPILYNLIDKKRYFFSIKNKKIMVIYDNQFNNKKTSQPISIDYLMITNKIKPKIKSILTCIQPKNIIVDKSISEWYKNNIKKECQNRDINFYSIKEQGVFQLEIE